MKKNKDSVLELSITSGKEAAVLFLQVGEREVPQSNSKRSHVDFALRSWDQGLSVPPCASG